MNSPLDCLKHRRRTLLHSAAGLGLSAILAPALALNAHGNALVPGRNAAPAPKVLFDRQQSQVLRAWIVHIIHSQLTRAPSPRWLQRDCASLVRFAVAESLRSHDEKWRQEFGLHGKILPPELNLSPEQAKLRHNWRLVDGSNSAYVGALELVQENSVAVGRNWNLAQNADLFLYDQGDAQHLMVWMGRYLAYHTGSVSKTDNGLRAVPIKKLLNWQDTRWQPVADNPNFAGVYRLGFLSPI